jgi:hypothetical protein
VAQNDRPGLVEVTGAADYTGFAVPFQQSGERRFALKEGLSGKIAAVEI